MDSSADIARDYLDWPVYGISQARKDLILAKELSRLTRLHASACADYGKLLRSRGISIEADMPLPDIPFLPVRLFKHHSLVSVPEERWFKTITSSGTTSQKPSRVVLDRDTSAAQTKALVTIFQSFLGPARLPMLVIDHPNVVRDRLSFSARGAGILGMAAFGRNHTYALLDEDMKPNMSAINAFAEKFRGQRVLLFGFTYVVWKYFFQVFAGNTPLPIFQNAVLVHGGGWKKLEEQKVSPAEFKRSLKARFGISEVHDYYGMAEQVGSVFVECEHGRLHAPAFADILIREPRDWSISPKGKEGIIQTMSLLPTSYPGHSLLTEDVGIELGVDDCPCGRLGRTFAVSGRVTRAEARGCSDTFVPGTRESPSLRQA